MSTRRNNSFVRTAGWMYRLKLRRRRQARSRSPEVDDWDASTKLKELPSSSKDSGGDDEVSEHKYVSLPERQISFAPSTAFGDEGPALRSLVLSGENHLCFWKNSSYEDPGRPFVRSTHDVNMEDIAAVLHDKWKIRSPRIVLVIVSNVSPLYTWTNSRQIEHFQNGLIKAANTTEMWIMTQGMNIGVSKLIGDAVHNELQRREALRCHKHPAQSKSSLPPITLIGIAREDLISYGDMLDGKLARVEIENEGNQPEENKFELNSDHSHFLVVKDNTVSKTGINHFLLKLEQYLSTGSEFASAEIADSAMKSSNSFSSLTSNEIPVVAVLIQGGYDCARLILDHLKKQLPVVVLRGTGGLADLLAYVYGEVFQRPRAFQDAEFVENFLKPELSCKITHNFENLRDNNLARNIFRDRIMECVRHAKQNGQTYLTLLNLHSHGCNLEDLDEHILRALFKSQRPNKSNWHLQMQKDLYLTLDWNSAHVAMSEVFMKDPSSKFKIDFAIFHEALTRPNRESFVDLFLDQGFQTHKYLAPQRLRILFNRSQNQEFFRTVCWEGVLGHSPISKLGRNFIDTDLNFLIEMCTGIVHFVSSDNLALDAMAMYVGDASSAERHALAIISMWAVFMNRGKLAKIFWAHSDQPIHLALILSMICSRLQDYISDTNVRQEVENLSRDFSEMAAGVLDASYKDSSCRSYDVLSEESPDWSYKTAVDIAADAKNRTFLSHPCCQKWLSHMFLGNIRIRDVTWGVVTCPQWLKVILCAFLIFPMYIWIRFKTDEFQACHSPYGAEYESDEEKDERDGEDDNLLDDQNAGRGQDFSFPKNSMAVLKEKGDTKLFEFGDDKNRDQVSTMLVQREVYVHSSPPLWRMIFLMWSAPITKFWTFQIFYILYLSLFSLAVLWPSCGNKYLDSAVCLWTSLIVVEYIRRTYILYKKYTSVPLFFKCVEILLIIAFIILYILSRIVNVGVFLKPYDGKVVLCFGLLYFFYRLIAVYLPISPTLGPLLYRVRLMVCVDFVNFMRMTILVIISGGIVIHAVLYPDYPMTPELFRRTFHKAWFSLFLTPIDDLQGDSRCNATRHHNSNHDYCIAGRYADYSCPNTGLWPYVFSIQYFVFLKLILLTLLYALFSATASKLQSETDAIWKFQRYQLVVDFSNRLRLPPPLSIFSYLLTIAKWIFCCFFCRKACKKRDETDLKFIIGSKGGADHRLSEKDYNYWRQLAHDYCKGKEAEENEKQITKKQMEMMMTVTEDVDYEKVVLKQLKGRVRELERMVTHSHVYLESIKHLLEKSEERGMLSIQTIHVLSRHTPYPGTRVQRFPVPDKYVPWEVMWTDYDPVAYTRPRSDFPIGLQPFVDEDILLLREQQDVGQSLPVFQWNCLSTNPAGISIDRESWALTEDGAKTIYKLDSEGVPRNIFGRTGLRGRGALPRWGPNHYSYIIVTRWHKRGNRVLEFIAMRGERREQISLPGGFVPGDQRYTTISRLLKSKDPTGMHTTEWTTHEHMIQFFENCREAESDDSYAELKTEMIQRGYMDDPWNTDQAWREIELWHLHFCGPECVSDYFLPLLSWRLVTEDLFIKMPGGQAVLLQDVVTNRLKPMIL